jgi:pimeloyl-ACP methyl ester carboxylesterase
MWLDNARTLTLSEQPPPGLTCDQLGKIVVPVTVARGELTRVFYKLIAETAARCIPGSKLVVLANDRHLAPLQDTAGFTWALLGFLANE